MARIHTMLFPGGKRKALTLSYDDGVVQDRRLTDLMRHYGVKGTFNLNTGLLGRHESMEQNGVRVDISTVMLQEIVKVYESFEVATHASEHSALIGCGSAALGEILEDRRTLEKMVPYLVLGHAYPFGLYDEQVIAMLKTAGIFYARTTDATGTFAIPRDFLRWNPTCHHSDPHLEELACRFCEKEALFGQPELFYLWGHSYEFDAEQNWDVIENFLKYVSGYYEEVWMATNIEIAAYVTAYRKLVFSADGKTVWNPSAAVIWLEILGTVYEIAPNAVMHLY